MLNHGLLFQVYGEGAAWQFLGWILVFTCLVLANEFARRTKAGGMLCFVVLPIILTVYFIAIYVSAAAGAEWALNNNTYVHMTSWFHYAKLYAATAGCIGFMMLKYKWGVGKTHWFKAFPFVIVAINILIAVCSDFESAIRGAQALAETGTSWWLSSEGVWLYGGWWNVLNGLAGIINILCMTGWWGIYTSKKKDDMLWPDMTWMFILAYDVWNFQYTYLNLPTHSWYCGVALLLAPTFAAAFWNKGGWIQNRANTLALWCMFAQVFPLFQDQGKFAVIPRLYADGFMDAATHPTAVDPTAQGVISVLSNVAPRQTHEICAKFFAGDVAGSCAEQLRAIPLCNALFCEVNPIPVKKALNLQGRGTGILRMPLCEMEEENAVKLEKAMKDYGIL